ncbi:MAG: response regulator, partial [Cyanobacteria bacterium P01_E01_bin.45]
MNRYSNRPSVGYMPFEHFDSLTAEVLVVDDDRVNRMALARILQKAGYAVREAENGQIALQQISDQAPNAIVLDINMPVMGGFETCRTLKSNPATQDIPVIFISTLEDVGDKVKAFEVGGSDYITRPFQPQEVLVRVASQLALQRQQQALQEWNQLLENQVKERTQKLEHMALYDSLTGLPNRLHLLQELTRRLRAIEQ